jgi:hypothetical protein
LIISYQLLHIKKKSNQELSGKKKMRVNNQNPLRALRPNTAETAKTYLYLNNVSA